MKHLPNKKWRTVLLVVMIVLIAAQFIQPPLKNPPVIADVETPLAIKSMLRTSCYDCHSNETQILWFDKITPANFLVASDVQQGRAALNFSEWNRYPPDRQKQILYETLNQIRFHTMPLQRYTFMHPGTSVEPSQTDSLKAYLTSLLVKQMTDTGKITAWHNQYSKWIEGETGSRNVRPAPNGIAFLPDYKNWVAISSTERQDNGTMRIIAGNDIAVQAIKTNHINPWPDGAAIAKIQWSQVLNSSGIINAGEFRQVDFMIKNKSKYAATHGWGYARWTKGTQLMPYGENAQFATGCANCHQAMRKNDDVFTIPVAIAANKGLQDKTIYSIINKQQGTMSTLYGNEMAAGFARSHHTTDYPAGSVLTMVTWQQKEDPHWFGALIPDRIISIEKITFARTNNKTVSPSYEIKQGNLPQKIYGSDAKAVGERIHAVISRTASVMP